MKASILAIGTELTTGQIINKNAATLSKKLVEHGVQTFMHVTIPDDRKLILRNLLALEKESDVIFVTGGLGPTSDDFTREVVAEWLQKRLVFDEQSWSQIVDRLGARGFPVREMQRQQCYYPEDALILENKQGTANAFKCQKNSTLVFVLPGPPREIESVWKDHIAGWLQEATKNVNKKITKSWDTLGVGESDVAYLVEDVLALFPKSKELEVGYRVHLPYVEVKITFDESQAAIYDETLIKLHEKLKEITVTRDFKDVAVQVMHLISSTDFTFYDFLSQGYLHTRLSPHFKNRQQWSFKQAAPKEITPDFFENEDDFLALLPYEEFKCLVMFNVRSNGARGQKVIEAPMKSAAMVERRLQYFSEMALVELLKSFSERDH